MVSEAPVRSTPHRFAQVRNLFPDAGELLSELVLRNALVRQICSEYELAAAGLRALELRNRHHDVERMQEYRQLLRHLEGDLARELRVGSSRQSTGVAPRRVYPRV